MNFNNMKQYQFLAVVGMLMMLAFIDVKFAFFIGWIIFMILLLTDEPFRNGK